MHSEVLFESGIDAVNYFFSLKADYFGFELSNLQILIGCSALFFVSYFIFRVLK